MPSGGEASLGDSPPINKWGIHAPGPRGSPHDGHCHNRSVSITKVRMSYLTRFGFSPVLGAILALAGASTAGATAVVEGRLNNADQAPAQGATVAMLSVTAPGSFGFISGSANAVDGVLRSSAAAAGPSNPGSPSPSSSVVSSFSEMVTFTSGFGKTAYLDYSFHGTMPQFGYTGATLSFGRIDLVAGTYRAAAALNRMGDFACDGDTQPCLEGTSIDITGSLSFIISAAPMNIGTSLRAYSDQAITVDFSDTGRVFLRTDAAWTSESGLFLSQAQPIFAPVPEPATALLVLGGLAGLGVWRLRRHAQIRSARVDNNN